MRPVFLVLFFVAIVGGSALAYFTFWSDSPPPPDPQDLSAKHDLSAKTKTPGPKAPSNMRRGSSVVAPTAPPSSPAVDFYVLCDHSPSARERRKGADGCAENKSKAVRLFSSMASGGSRFAFALPSTNANAPPTFEHQVKIPQDPTRRKIVLRQLEDKIREWVPRRTGSDLDPVLHEILLRADPERPFYIVLTGDAEQRPSKAMDASMATLKALSKRKHLSGVVFHLCGNDSSMALWRSRLEELGVKTAQIKGC